MRGERTTASGLSVFLLLATGYWCCCPTLEFGIIVVDAFDRKELIKFSRVFLHEEIKRTKKY